MVKRTFDLIFCVLALPFLGPVLCFIAICIKITSPGPIFYRGLRTGLNNKKFKIWKFRSMVVNAESMGGGTTALNDPRILGFGKLLRKYKLDELPQVFNVLKGEMSLVGPRPELPKYTDQYKDVELLILTVRPGITDFSSIEFNALDKVVGADDADKVFEEHVLWRKNQLRLQYVKNRSFKLDVWLILLTLSCLAKKLFKHD